MPYSSTQKRLYPLVITLEFITTSVCIAEDTVILDTVVVEDTISVGLARHPIS